MANLKISELTSATSLTGTELIPVVQSGITKSVTPTVLLNAYTTTQEILTHNSVNSIIVGNKNTDGSIVLHYYCNRGSLYSAGRITLINRGGSTVDVYHQFDADDCGIDNVGTPMTADFTGAYIRLNITVDNISANDALFYYNTIINKL